MGVLKSIESTLLGARPGQLPSLLLRSGVVAMCAVVAVVVPFFGDMLALIGATTQTALCFLLPCTFYLRLLPAGPGQRLHRAAVCGIGLWGLFVAVCGTYAAV